MSFGVCAKVATALSIKSLWLMWWVDSTARYIVGYTIHHKFDALLALKALLPNRRFLRHKQFFGCQSSCTFSKYVIAILLDTAFEISVASVEDDLTINFHYCDIGAKKRIKSRENISVVSTLDSIRWSRFGSSFISRLLFFQHFRTWDDIGWWWEDHVGRLEEVLVGTTCCAVAWIR